VQTNKEEFTGRVWVLVLDDLQTRPIHTMLVQAAARQFIRRYVNANDLAAVVTTGGSASASQDFTNSPARLLSAVGKFIGQKTPRAQAFDQESEYKARNTYTALRNLAEYLGSVHGRRKAILWFGEGVDYDITNPFTARGAETIRLAMQEVVDAANRQNVSFYGIDARGLGAGMDETIEMSEAPDDAAMRDEVRRAQDSLRVVSEQTGGFAIVEKNDLNASFERVVRDNSSYYVLGYYPTNDKRDGKFRKVQVRVARPGLRVLSRDGYAAPKGKAPATSAVENRLPPEIGSALASPVPSRGVLFSIGAAPLTGPAGKATLALVVELDPSTLKFVEQSGKFIDTVELHVLAIDQNGKTQAGGRSTIPMTLGDRSYESVRATGVRFLHHIAVPPGRYQLRVAAKDLNSDAIGTVRQLVDVPDFSKGDVNVSGIQLTSAAASQMPTVNPQEQLAGVLPAPATAARQFDRGDTLSVFAEVYDNQASTPHRVSIASTVLADDGRAMFTASDERSSADLQGSKGGYGYQQQIPLAQFPPGRYVLRIEAKSLLAKGQAATREVEFRVR
jgi:VWFA-related protein